MTTGRAESKTRIPVLVVSLPDGGEAFHPLLGREITVGRDRANRVRIDDHFVSKFHAKLFVRGGEITIVDLDSANKTRVNGDVVSQRVLQIDDEIRFASVRCWLRMPKEPGTEGEEEVAPPDEVPAADLADRAPLSSTRSPLDGDSERQVFWAGPPESASRRLAPSLFFVAVIAILLVYALK